VTNFSTRAYSREDLFSKAALRFLLHWGAPALDDNDFQIVEAEGATLEALFANFLERLVDQWRDYRFVAREIEVVKLVEGRVGAHVIGAYLPNDLDPPALPVFVRAEQVRILPLPDGFQVEVAAI
jgi:hypothetical protein